jgi:hypothetical protein
MALKNGKAIASRILGICSVLLTVFLGSHKLFVWYGIAAILLAVAGLVLGIKAAGKKIRDIRTLLMLMYSMIGLIASLAMWAASLAQHGFG